MADPTIVNACMVFGIVRGTCVVVGDEDQILYAGPIRTSPTPPKDGHILLGHEDFETFKTYVDKRLN